MKNQLKLLLIPGFAKAGTTFIFDQLIKNKDAFNIPTTKELGFLKLKQTPNDYFKNFHTDDERKTYIDATPNYIEPRFEVCNHLKKHFTENDIKILFCIRSPVERAYSRYIDELRRMYWLFATSPYSFLDPNVLSTHLYPIAPIIRKWVNSFGQENIFSFTTEIEKPKLDSKLLQWLGVSENWLSENGNRYEGGYLPQIYYDNRNTILVNSGGELYELPPKTLLVNSGEEYSDIIWDYPYELANKLLDYQSTWTRNFHKSQLGSVQLKIEVDFSEVLDMLKLPNIQQLLPKMPLIQAPKALPLHITNNLKYYGKFDEVFKFETDFFDESLVSGKLKKLHDELEMSYIDFHNPKNIEEYRLIANRIINNIEEQLNEFGLIVGRVEAMAGLCFSVGNIAPILRIFETKPYIRKIIDIQQIKKSLEYYKPNLSENQFTQISLAMRPSGL